MPALIFLLLCLLSAPLAAKTYRWVDDQGKVHYGDRIPPEYAKQERETLNERGIVIDRNDRQKTSAELAREQAEAEAAAAREAQQAEQERYDRFLISTYATQDQLILRRDEQLTILDGQIGSGEVSIVQSEATLQDLQARAEGLKANNRPVPDTLSKQIKTFESALAGGRRAIEALRKERQEVAEGFARDLERYRLINR